MWLEVCFWGIREEFRELLLTAALRLPVWRACEWVLSTVNIYTWRDEDDGGKMRMSSINAIVFPCGTVTTYRTGVDGPRQPAVPAEGAACPLSLRPLPQHKSFTNWNIGIKWMENHFVYTLIQFRLQICWVKRVGAHRKGDEGRGPGGGPLWGRTRSRRHIS